MCEYVKQIHVSICGRELYKEIRESICPFCELSGGVESNGWERFNTHCYTDGTSKSIECYTDPRNGSKRYNLITSSGGDIKITCNISNCFMCGRNLKNKKENKKENKKMKRFDRLVKLKNKSAGNMLIAKMRELDNEYFNLSEAHEALFDWMNEDEEELTYSQENAINWLLEARYKDVKFSGDVVTARYFCDGKEHTTTFDYSHEIVKHLFYILDDTNDYVSLKSLLMYQG